MDAEGIEGVGLGGLFAFGGEGQGRNEPSIQQGRRAGQRSAAGRGAEKDEAERKPNPAGPGHGAAPFYFFL